MSGTAICKLIRIFENLKLSSIPKFLDFWKYADPSIAEVVDAKKRVAGLKSN